MTACRVLPILVLASSLALANGACFSLQPHIPNQYCEQNCNHPVNPFCPPDFCSCTSGSGPAPASLTCSSPLSFIGIDTWCNNNCNAEPSFCPPIICTCVDSDTGNTDDLPEPLNCTAKVEPVTATWCNDNCGTYCPFKFCDCGYPVNTYISTCETVTDDLCFETCNTFGAVCPTCCQEVAPSASPAPSPVFAPLTITADDQDSCCSSGGHSIYFAQQGKVYRGTILPDDDFAIDTTAATLCADTQSAVSIAVDSEGGAYVADLNAGEVIYVDPSCNPESNIVVTTQFTSSIRTPTTIAIVDGGLVVGGLDGFSYALSLNENRAVSAETRLDTQSRPITQLRSYNGQTFLLQQQFYVAFSDGSTIEEIFTAHDMRAPAIADITVSNCGLYALATSGQVFRCTDPLDKDSCDFVCGPLGTSCGLVSPFAISVDCDCNIFISNTGSNNLVTFEGTNSTRFVRPGFDRLEALSVFSDAC